MVRMGVLLDLRSRWLFEIVVVILFKVKVTTFYRFFDRDFSFSSTKLIFYFRGDFFKPPIKWPPLNFS